MLPYYSSGCKEIKSEDYDAKNGAQGRELLRRYSDAGADEADVEDDTNGYYGGV
jgi:hypothetical protein